MQIEMADGRIMGVPRSWFPPIHHATDEQRKNYNSYGNSVYWQDVDDGIDLTAMLTGMYIVPVFERESRPMPHVPDTWVYLYGGARHSDGVEGVPFVHDTRNIPQAFCFADDRLVFSTWQTAASFAFRLISHTSWPKPAIAKDRVINARV